MLTQGLHGPEGPDAAPHAEAAGDGIRGKATKSAGKQVGQAKHGGQHACGGRDGGMGHEEGELVSRPAGDRDRQAARGSQEAGRQAGRQAAS